jgi:ATPase subunit of ABC transporter with duplicated ATPase domains
MLNVKAITISHGGNPILQGINFVLGKKDKIALIGPNGSGKSTLIKTLAGQHLPDSGSISIDKDIKIGYLPQIIEIKTKETVSVYIKRVTGISDLEKQMELLTEKLNDSKALKQYGEIQEKFLKLDGYNIENKLKIILQGLGLDSLLIERKISDLSGGQKSKVAIAALLLVKPDILLLDEPTNNLDLTAIIWLETFLSKTDLAFLVVSHDREFIDRVASRLLIIDTKNQTIKDFNGTYSKYIEETIKTKNRQSELYEIQKRKIEETIESIDKKKNWANKGKKQKTTDNDKYIRGFRRDRSAKIAQNAKVLENRLKKQEKITKPADDQALIIPLNPRINKAKHVINVKNLIAGYKDGFKIGPITLQFNYGSRTAIIGANGSGKTTLLKTITGEISPLLGTIEKNKALIIGSVSQELITLPKQKTILEFLTEKATLEKHLIYNILTEFGFDAENVNQKIGALSPGEQMRLLIAKYSILSVNVLILDEPTNHLDIDALNALETLLMNYQGTIILVSHDRHFLGLFQPDKILMMEDQCIREIADFEEYLKKSYDNAQKMIKKFRS